MDATVIVFRYRNHRNEEAVRTARPIRIWFGSTAFHPEAQWFLEAFDLDRGETRDFALTGLLGGWGPAAPREVSRA